MVLHEQAWERVEARAARAGLALTAWVGLLAVEVATGTAGMREAQLEEVSAARIGVSRVGSAVNSLAATEHLGTAVPVAQLEAVLARLAVRVQAAAAAAGGVDVEPSETPAGGAGRGRSRGRRSQGPVRRQRVITVWFSPGERAAVGAAAAAQGLSAAAWVGALVEDPAAIRPLRGEMWGAVWAVRKALRRVATNVAQITEVRTRRGVEVPAELTDAQLLLQAAIRECLAAEGRLTARPGAGAAA